MSIVDALQNAKSVVIGGKTVKKIMSGDTLIWEAPSSGGEPIVVFPLETRSFSIAGAYSYCSDDIDLAEDLIAGGKYIIYINGTGHSFTAKAGGIKTDDGQVELIPSDSATLNSYLMRYQGWHQSATVEIHYIP